MRRFIAFLLFATATMSYAAPPRVALFESPGFPTVDAPAISEDVLSRALKGLTVDRLATPSDFGRVATSTHDVLVLPYGSAFPLDAWTQIRDYIRSGGSVVVLGGAPFHQPVLRSADRAWVTGTRQTSFAHELLIGPAEPVKVDPAWTPLLLERDWTRTVSGASTVWALTVRLATRSEFPAEHGSEGEREGVVRPLIHLVSADRIPRACPIVEIDRLRGSGKGGRWIFAATDARLDANTIRALVTRAASGASELEARPVIASLRRGETPSIRVMLLEPRARDDAASLRAQVVVRDDSGREVHRTSMALEGAARSGVAQLATSRPLEAGLYHVEVTTPRASAVTGFWVRDDALMERGPRLTVSRDWIRRDGKVMPVIGTTYMASDVHRQFLFEPNPHVWDRDFGRMAKLGINFVRTGIWTGWSRAMSSDGTPNDAFLRALEAYVQSAAKHGIVVNFTFFAFLPQPFGGTNPYLDPRSLEGQKKFAAGVASHFRGCGWIHYDLINEPSYAPPEGLWSNRPVGDEWEKKAWRAWVTERHGDGESVLRDRWGIADGDPLALPRQGDIYYSQIRESRQVSKARDFAEFSHRVVAQWASTMRDAIRAAGGDVLVTLGQDEGGTSSRPSQQLHADAVDYTCIHPWWQNDDALANGVFARVPEKPGLFQETGLMRLEDAHGRPWRSPELAADVLGRKFVTAFAARSAGAVEWAWNINPYMPIDNESVIGFFRADGTAKPELDVIARLGTFFAKTQDRLDDFDPEQIVVIIPQTRLFMARPGALDGTRRLIRVLSERFGIVPAAVSDLALTAERLRGARLIIAASPEFLDARAAAVLDSAVRSGARLLVTGAATGDAYGARPAAMAGLWDEGRPVRFREPWRDALVTFDAGLQETLRSSTQTAAREFTAGVWREPLPLEYAREDAPLVELLGEVLRGAGVTTHPSGVPVAANVLSTPSSVFVIVVNDNARDAKRAVNVGGRVRDIDVPANGWALVLFDRATGESVVETTSRITGSPLPGSSGP